MTSLLTDLTTLAGVDRMLALLVVKVTLILLAALAITVVMQRATAGARHLVWLVTLGALLMVPALGAWGPLELRILPPDERLSALGPRLSATAPVGAGAPERPAGSAEGREPRAESTVDLAALTATPDDDVAAANTGTLTAATRWLSDRPLATIASIWGIVVLGILAWLAWGALQVRRIVRRAHPLDTADWTGPLYEVADRLGLEEAPRLVGSRDARMPFACGLLTPTIVLPDDSERWTLDRRRAVLLHELAHVKRRDLLGHTLGRLACAVYWFHPLAWTAARRLRAESERACDDMAVASGARPSDYAEHLLEIVTSVRHDRTPAVALAMARRKEFEGRMLAILDGEVRRAGPGRRQSAVLIAALGCMSLLVGAAAPAPRAPDAGVQVTAADDSSKKRARAKADAKREPAGRSEREDGWVALSSAGDETDAAMDASIDDPDAEAAEDARADAEADALADSRDAERDRTRDRIIDAEVSRDVAAVRVSPNVATSVDARIGPGLQVGPTAGVRGRTLHGDERPELLASVLRTDSSATLRRIAAWGLADHARDDVAASALAQALRRDTSPEVREMAAWALANGRRHAAALEALGAAATSDAEEDVRGIATWALGNLGLRDTEEALLRALDDRSRRVRIRAAWALGNIGLRRAPARVVALLRDEDRDVRMLAAWVLYQTEDPSAAPALEAALRDEQDKELRMAYIRAVAAMGERSVDAVRPLLQSSDPEVRSMAVRALAGGQASGPWPWPWPEPRPHP